MKTKNEVEYSYLDYMGSVSSISKKIEYLNINIFIDMMVNNFEIILYSKNNGNIEYLTTIEQKITPRTISKLNKVVSEISSRYRTINQEETSKSFRQNIINEIVCNFNEE